MKAHDLTPEVIHLRNRHSFLNSEDLAYVVLGDVAFQETSVLQMSSANEENGCYKDQDCGASSPISVTYLTRD